jgi:hypothetical protein
MNIRKEYIEILHKIRTICVDFDTTRADNLLKIIRMSTLKDVFNTINYWNKFKSNSKKPYSILNTDKKSDLGNGMHWVGVFQDNNTIFIYDSFARKHVMNDFVDMMTKQGFLCIYVNKKSDQGNLQEDCGIRSFLWLIFVEKYGIKEASKI